MNAKTKKEYFKNVNRCPYCKVESLDIGEKTFDDNYATVHITCESCGKEWKDIYTLTNVIEL